MNVKPSESTKNKILRKIGFRPKYFKLIEVRSILENTKSDTLVIVFNGPEFNEWKYPFKNKKEFEKICRKLGSEFPYLLNKTLKE